MWKQQFTSIHQQSPEPASTSKEWSDKPVNHTDGYKIVIVLDESASMETIENDMRKALNGLILEQKTVDRKCYFTLVKFNHTIRRVIANKNLKCITEITTKDYTPKGSTALFDAVGDTINWFRYERDVLLVVITDGQENSSKKYHKPDVMKMLKEKEDYCDWSYVYLGCDIQTSRQGNTMGFKKSAQISNCCVKQSSYGNFIADDLNCAIKNRRTQGISVQSQLNQKY